MKEIILSADSADANPMLLPALHILFPECKITVISPEEIHKDEEKGREETDGRNTGCG